MDQLGIKDPGGLSGDRDEMATFRVSLLLIGGLTMFLPKAETYHPLRSHSPSRAISLTFILVWEFEAGHWEGDTS